MDDLAQFRQAVQALPWMIGEPTFEPVEDDRVRAHVIDHWHEYVIDLVPRSECSPRGYLGGICNNREPHPGEQHIRGNDMSDGPFTLETWGRIMADILAAKISAKIERAA